VTKKLPLVRVNEERAAAWSLRRNGRLYELFARSRDGSSLYQTREQRGRDFWLVRADGSERPWSYPHRVRSQAAAPTAKRPRRRLS
jgi:hypothetical protein